MIGVPVAAKPVDNTPRGRLRARYDWVTGPAPPPPPGAAMVPPREEAVVQEGWLLCDVGEHARGLPLLRSAVDFDALRGLLRKSDGA